MPLTGLGSLASGLFSGLKAAREDDLADATVELKKAALLRQLEDAERKQLSDVYTLIKDDPVRALDVIPKLRLRPELVGTLMHSAQRNAALLQKARVAEAAALRGAPVELDEPEALRFVSPTSVKILQEALAGQQAKQMEQHLLTKLREYQSTGKLTPENIPLFIQDTAKTYQGPGDFLKYLTERKVADSLFGGVMPPETQARQNAINAAVSALEMGGPQVLPRIALKLKGYNVNVNDLLPYLSKELEAEVRSYIAGQQTAAEARAKEDILNEPTATPPPDWRPPMRLPTRRELRTRERGETAGAEAKARAIGEAAALAEPAYTVVKGLGPNGEVIYEPISVGRAKANQARAEAEARETSLDKRLKEAKLLLDEAEQTNKTVDVANKIARALSLLTFSEYLVKTMPPEQQAQYRALLEKSQKLMAQYNAPNSQNAPNAPNAAPPTRPAPARSQAPARPKAPPKILSIEPIR